MAFFKTDEERKAEEERKLKEAEEDILTSRQFWGKVGQIHQGLSSFGLWGVRDNGKAKFKPTKFELHDDKLLIVRNRQIIQPSQIKEIFFEDSFEAIIILLNDNGIPIQGTGSKGRRELKAFVNVLNKLIEDYNSNPNNLKPNTCNEEKSEDKIDKLLKLGEMYDKGLLSDDEFASLKQELLSGNNTEPVNTFEEDVETSENICGNCGSEIEEDSKFCAECGNKLD